MQPLNYHRPVQASHSDKLQKHRRLLIVHGERERKNSYERGRSPTAFADINFVSSHNIPPAGKLATNPATDHSRNSYGNTRSLSRYYNQMMSQSIGRAKRRPEAVVPTPPKNIRAASFVTRILDRGGRSSYLRRSRADEVEGNWRESLILEINRNEGFIPVSKAKKASFFYVVGKRQPRSSPQPEQYQIRATAKTKREFDDYLIFIGAGPQYLLRPIPSFDNLRKAKKPVLAFNRKIITAVLRLISLTGKQLISDEVDLDHKNRHLVEYSHLYFTLSEKIELYVTLSCSLLQGFRARLREVFVLTRMFMLTVLTLALERRLFSKAVDKISKLHQFCLMLEECYSTLLEVLTELCDTATNSETVFTLSFKILRSMYSMEKNCDELKHLSKEMHSTQLLSHRASIDIERHYAYLLQRGLNSNSFEEKLLKSEMTLSWRYMRIPPYPYLPPNLQGNQISVVLDLEETLIWNDGKGTHTVRPRLPGFLAAFHEQFEFIVFSCSPKPESDQMLEYIDPKSIYFRYRLYREHMNISEGKQYKDFTKIGRPISKLIAVDDCSDNLRYSPYNGITIQRFEGDPEDHSMDLLSDVLNTVLAKKPTDVRYHLRAQQATLSYIVEKSEESITSARDKLQQRRRS